MDRHQHRQPNMPSSSRSAPQRAHNPSQLAGYRLLLAVSSWAASGQLGLRRPSQQPLLTTAPSCPLTPFGINVASVLHGGVLTGSSGGFSRSWAQLHAVGPGRTLSAVVLVL